jgi:hypothetical protein
MIYKRKDTAILLLGIFFFPIIFQSLLILWHNSHGIKQEYQYCDKENSENTSCSDAFIGEPFILQVQ